MSKSVVLIPAFNAAKTIKDVIKGIDRNIVDEIIVVNDGSADNTEEVLAAVEGINIVSHPQNRGYGATTITLYEQALKRNFDFFVTLHADGAHNPTGVGKILQPLEEGVADVVVGNRIKGVLENSPLFLRSKFLGAVLRGSMPAYKFMANIFLTRFQNWCYGTSFGSFHSGFRACTRKALESVPFDRLTGWYQYDTEFLVKANEKNLRIKEIPITSYYSKDAGSNAPVVKYGLRVIAAAGRYWVRKNFRNHR